MTITFEHDGHKFSAEAQNTETDYGCEVKGVIRNDKGEVVARFSEPASLSMIVSWWIADQE